MRRRPKDAVISLLLLLSSSTLLRAQTTAPSYPQRWCYLASLIGTDDEAAKTVDWLKLAKDAHCTHLLVVCSRDVRIHLPGNDDFLARIHRIRDAARDLGLKLVICALPTGYASQYPFFDGNLLAGLPVKDAPFIVKANQIIPDPDAALPIANGGFDDFADNTFAGWDNRTLPGVNTWADTTDKHSGKASFKLGSFDEARKTDPRKGPSASLVQKVKVKPFQHYRITYWCKAQGGIYPAAISIISDKANRNLIYSGIPIQRDKQNINVPDWTPATVTFNTLDSTEITLTFGLNTRPGTAWLDNLTIAPAPPINIVRRDICPLKVTSAEGAGTGGRPATGQVTYEEGKDFKPLFDPVINAKPFAGELDTKHNVPFELTADSRLKDGQKLLVSYYHTQLIDWDQMVLSMQEPRILDIFQQEVKNDLEHWKPDGLFLNYDEIRMGGWELEPDGQTRTPGQILARHIQQANTIVKKLAPETTVYTWSDMFTPFHNARPFQDGNKVNGYYWLVNGNWDGSWDGLPKDIVIMNWYAPSPESIKFFSDRGHAQILCGYYDDKTPDGMKRNIHKWITQSQSLPNIQGFMYTTWNRNYTNLKPYYQFLDTYPTWSTTMPAK